MRLKNNLEVRPRSRSATSKAAIVFSTFGTAVLPAIASTALWCAAIARSNAGMKCSGLTSPKGGSPNGVCHGSSSGLDCESVMGGYLPVEGRRVGPGTPVTGRRREYGRIMACGRGMAVIIAFAAKIWRCRAMCGNFVPGGGSNNKRGARFARAVKSAMGLKSIAVVLVRGRHGGRAVGGQQSRLRGRARRPRARSSAKTAPGTGCCVAARWWPGIASVPGEHRKQEVLYLGGRVVRPFGKFSQCKVRIAATGRVGAPDSRPRSRMRW